MSTFRAIWPITDHRVSWFELCKAAREEVPILAGQASARIVGPGRFSIADSRNIPGSGRITENVLIYEAPARAIDRRAYRGVA